MNKADVLYTIGFFLVGVSIGSVIAIAINQSSWINYISLPVTLIIGIWLIKRYPAKNKRQEFEDYLRTVK
jgi:cytochrome c biogenesis protein CcdA